MLPDANYYNVNGVQPAALKRMFDRVTAPIDPSADYLSNNIAAEDWGFEKPTTQSGMAILLGLWNFYWYLEVGFLSCLVI